MTIIVKLFCSKSPNFFFLLLNYVHFEEVGIATTHAQSIDLIGGLYVHKINIIYKTKNHHIKTVVGQLL